MSSGFTRHDEKSDRPVAHASRRDHGRTRANPTIWDVARASNVSIGTVSKALNASGRLSAETAREGSATSRAIGYRPNDLAHSLHRARSMTVGMSVERQLRPLHLSDRRGARAEPVRLRDRGLHVQCDRRPGARAPAHRSTARQAHRRSCRHRAPHRPAASRSSQRSAACRSSTCSPTCDEAGRALPPARRPGGAALAVRHLAALGRKRIAHVTGPERFEAVRLRESGYRATLAESDCRRARATTARDAGRRPGAARRSRPVRERAARPTRIFCGNDQIARGAVDALARNRPRRAG